MSDTLTNQQFFKTIRKYSPNFIANYLHYPAYLNTQIHGVATLVPDSFDVDEQAYPFFTAEFSLTDRNLIKYAYITCSQEQRLALEHLGTSFQFTATITGYDPVSGYPYLTLINFSPCSATSTGEEYERFLSECEISVSSLPGSLTGSTVETASGIVYATNDFPESYFLRVDGFDMLLDFSDEERPLLAELAESCQQSAQPRELKVSISNSDGSKMIVRLLDIQNAIAPPTQQPTISQQSSFQPINHQVPPIPPDQSQPSEQSSLLPSKDTIRTYPKVPTDQLENQDSHLHWNSSPPDFLPQPSQFHPQPGPSNDALNSTLFSEQSPTGQTHQKFGYDSQQQGKYPSPQPSQYNPQQLGPYPHQQSPYPHQQGVYNPPQPINPNDGQAYSPPPPVPSQQNQPFGGQEYGQQNQPFGGQEYGQQNPTQFGSIPPSIPPQPPTSLPTQNPGNYGGDLQTQYIRTTEELQRAHEEIKQLKDHAERIGREYELVKQKLRAETNEREKFLTDLFSRPYVPMQKMPTIPVELRSQQSSQRSAEERRQSPPPVTPTVPRNQGRPVMPGVAGPQGVAQQPKAKARSVRPTALNFKPNVQATAGPSPHQIPIRPNGPSGQIPRPVATTQNQPNPQVLPHQMPPNRTGQLPPHQTPPQNIRQHSSQSPPPNIHQPSPGIHQIHPPNINQGPPPNIPSIHQQPANHQQPPMGQQNVMAGQGTGNASPTPAMQPVYPNIHPQGTPPQNAGNPVGAGPGVPNPKGKFERKHQPKAQD